MCVDVSPYDNLFSNFPSHILAQVVIIYIIYHDYFMKIFKFCIKFYIIFKLSRAVFMRITWFLFSKLKIKSETKIVGSELNY